MKERCKKLLKNENGSVLPLVSLSIVVLLSMSALVIDLGSLFVTKTHLKKAANASVLSAGQELVTSASAVEAIIDEILEAHNESESLVNNTINLGSSVSVELRREVPLTFAKLLGFDSVPVEAISTAQILSMGRAKGAAPIGIDEAFDLEYGQEYTLKVDQTEVDTGNFGILALAGPGANTYEDNLRNGYSGEIEVGDIIDTQTGNIAGKTRTVVNERINACSYSGDDLENHIKDHRDCSRVLLIPVYRPYNHTTNQLKQVEIVGFSFFYLVAPMSSKDTSIRGKFIDRVGTGYSDSGAVSRGAYSIKLVE